MQKPTTILKNFTDEVFHYTILTRNGLVIRDTLEPNSYVDHMNVGVGDKLKLESDNYICTYIFNYGANPKYFITYPETKVKNMFANLGYNPIVVSRKQDTSNKLDTSSKLDTYKQAITTTSPTTPSDDEGFTTGEFIMYIIILLLFVGSLLGIVYLLTRKKFSGATTGAGISIKEIEKEPIFI